MLHFCLFCFSRILTTSHVLQNKFSLRVYSAHSAMRPTHALWGGLLLRHPIPLTWDQGAAYPLQLSDSTRLSYLLAVMSPRAHR
ncbi:hypothetical protein C8Q72DRAFT_829807 [Fomitopsis betulina]|nr:hypothetical protein C8Q72DRAFT_829807 [Fomitopsis betulina]